MSSMTPLSIAESVHIDTQRLTDIINDLGTAPARTMISMSLQQVKAGLATLSAAVSKSDRKAISQAADRVSRDAWQVGLVTLSAVAVDVVDCANNDDCAAMAAVLARLERVATQSLAEMWEDPEDEA